MAQEVTDSPTDISRVLCIIQETVAGSRLSHPALARSSLTTTLQIGAVEFSRSRKQRPVLTAAPARRTTAQKSAYRLGLRYAQASLTCRLLPTAVFAERAELLSMRTVQVGLIGADRRTKAILKKLKPAEHVTQLLKALAS
jgi:hypothetical protein